MTSRHLSFYQVHSAWCGCPPLEWVSNPTRKQLLTPAVLWMGYRHGRADSDGCSRLRCAADSDATRTNSKRLCFLTQVLLKIWTVIFQSWVSQGSGERGLISPRGTLGSQWTLRKAGAVSPVVWLLQFVMPHHPSSK